MNQISNFECPYIENVQISCMMVDNEPWFKGLDVVRALEYKQPRNTLSNQVPPKFKSSFEQLLIRSGAHLKCTRDANELKASWISEAGLYKLVLKAKVKSAEVFQDWVCAEVLPSIRKTGSYSNYRYSRNQNELGETATERWKTVRELALGKEDELHYKIINHIKKEYPDAQPIGGIGEHLTTDHARMDAYLKGYTKGQPDIIILRKLPNAFQDVLAIELTNPNGRGVLDDTQIKYHKLLKDQCNIETIVGHEYDKIIIQIALHYQQVFARAKTLAITDKPQNYDFSTNNNPQYWCNKLKNKQGLVNECAKRELPEEGLYFKTNREIASILITFDTKA